MTGILNIQFKPVLDNKEINLKKVEFFIKKNSKKKLDLVVLPEYFSTGLIKKHFEDLAEDENGGNTIKEICKLAKKYNTNIIAGSILTKETEKFYNTSFAINRDGNILAKYNKIHLNNFMGDFEDCHITAGISETIVEYDFANVGIAIGNDIRFPLHYKKLAQRGANIIITSTAWKISNEVFNCPELKHNAIKVWEAINTTRAFDNHVYCIFSNQVGEIDESYTNFGYSMTVAPTAQVLANSEDKQCGMYSEIDLDLVNYYKSIFPIANID